MRGGRLKTGSALTVVVFCLLLVQSLPSTAFGQAAKPVWVEGDIWKYETSQMDLYTQNDTFEFSEISTINLNGTEYEVCVLDTTSVISMYGIEITYTGHNYYLRSNLAVVKTEMTMSMMGMSSSTVTTYEPPKEDYDFPLSVGKSWTSTFTESSYTTFNGNFMGYNNDTKTVSYTVLEEGSTTVEAGEFECYLIEADDGEGTITSIYYSEEVKNAVKIRSESGGMMIEELELTYYEVTLPSGNGGDGDGGTGGGGFDLFAMPWLLLLILIPIILVAFIVGLVAARKRKQAREAAAPSPTYGTTPTIQQTYAAPGPTMPSRPLVQAPPARARPVAGPPPTAKPPPPQARPTAAPPPTTRPAPPPQIRPAAAPPPTAKPAQPPAPQQPKSHFPPRIMCPTCGKPLSFIYQYKKHYCYNCKKYT